MSETDRRFSRSRLLFWGVFNRFTVVVAVVACASAGAMGEFAFAGTSAPTQASSDAASALALQNDGKFVAAGRGSLDFALARYRPDGSLDRGFGVGGRVVTHPLGADGAGVAAVAVQGDGKLVALGSASYKGNDSWPVLARYRRDGRLDRAFGRKGIVGQPYRGFGNGSLVGAYAVALQRGGKIVTAGDSFRYDTTCPGGVCAPPNSLFALARFLPGGRLDPGFGKGGNVLTDVGPESVDVAEALVVQKDGKLVLAGFTGDSNAPQRKGDFALARYRRNGQLDATFGNGGKVVTGFGPKAVDEAEAAALQEDGKIVVAGRSCALPHGQTACRLAVARYLPDGRLDPSFAGGTVLLRFGRAGFNEASAVAIDRDGKIVVAGRSGQSTRRPSRFALARFLRTGRLDRSFGSGGRVLTQIRPGKFDAAAALVLARRGKILAAGQTGLGPYSADDFALARYRRDGRLDRTFGKAGKLRTDFSRATRPAATSRAAPPHGGTLLAAARHAFTVHADGSAYHRLRLGRTWLGAAMAPNGERIAFAQGLVIRKNGGVVVRKELVKVVWPDGTHGRTVATLTAVSSGRFTGLDWSPDSRKIAITTQRGLWIAQANGKRAQLIVPRPGAAAAVWSPRGDRIAFMRAFNRHGELTAAHDIYIVSPNGSNFHRTTTAQGYGGQPVSWSPDGQRIVYSTRRNTHLANSTLHSLDVDTGVTLTLGLGDSPTWSPRGDLIAFSINQNDGAGGPVLAIAVERPDGTGRRVLAKAYTQPVWSPSGEQIAFGKYVEHGLWRVPAGGGTPQKIASGGQVNHIEWSR